MKLSENTLAILKNYANINAGIVLKPGKVLETVNQSSTLRTKANISETIPVEFGIYDLTTFLANISQLGGKDVDIEFVDSCIRLYNNDGFALDYYGAEPSLIKHPTKEVADFEFNVEFTIHNQQFDKMLKLAALNRFSHISFIGEENNLFVKVFSVVEGKFVSNSGKYRIGDNAGGNFEARFLVENMKLLPLDYNVKLNHDGVAKFTSEDEKIEYYIVMQEVE